MCDIDTQERLLEAAVDGFLPGDFCGPQDRLCTCGRWVWLGAINPCGSCLYEAGAPWQHGYWNAVGQLAAIHPTTEWAERWRDRELRTTQ